MDLTVYNSFILCEKATGKKVSYTKWKVDRAEQIVKETVLPGYRQHGKPTLGALPMHLEGWKWAHFPRQIPANAVKLSPSRRCHICEGKKSGSLWECEKCGVAFHMPLYIKLFRRPLNHFASAYYPGFKYNQSYAGVIFHMRAVKLSLAFYGRHQPDKNELRNTGRGRAMKWIDEHYKVYIFFFIHWMSACAPSSLNKCFFSKSVAVLRCSRILKNHNVHQYARATSPQYTSMV